MREIIILSAALWAAAPASAQPRDYRATVDAAVAEFDARRFPEARALFRAAHRLQPSARTLRGVGLASFEMSDYASAHRELTASLADTRRPLSETQRQEVTALLGRCDVFLGRYRLEVSPLDAEVRVDGARVDPEPDGAVLLSLGAHAIGVAAPGYEPRTQRIETRGGERLTLTFALSRAGAPAAAGPTTAGPAAGRLPAAGPALEERPTSAPVDRGPSIALGVTGGVLVASSLGLGLGWWLDRQDADDRCAVAGAACRNSADVAAARDAAAGVTVSAAVLGVTAWVVALVLWVLSPDERPSAARCPARGMPGCVGSF